MMPVALDDTTEVLEHGWGNMFPLPVVRQIVSGDHVLGFACVPTEHERELLSDPDGDVAITVVIVHHANNTMSFSLKIVAADVDYGGTH